MYETIFFRENDAIFLSETSIPQGIDFFGRVRGREIYRYRPSVQRGRPDVHDAVF